MNTSSLRCTQKLYLQVTPLAVASRQLIRVACVSMLIAIATLSFSTKAIAADANDRQHAIEIAKEKNGGDGKVLGVSTIQDANGNTQYAVKLLSNGRVRVFRINKAN